MPRDDPHPFPPPGPAPGPQRRTITTAGGAVVIAAATALTAFLGAWEPDKRDPGLVYADDLAGGLPTVCKGITRHVTATPVVVGQRWSDAKCRSEEETAIIRVQVRLAQCFRIGNHVPQSVFDAATSHAWNFGVSATCGSLAMQAWNRGDWALGCTRISTGPDGERVWAFVKTGKLLPSGKPEYRFVRGLANRRDAETKLCMEDVR